MAFFRGPDRMNDHQKAVAKGQAKSGNRTQDLANAANGYGVTRVERERAQRTLEKELGPKGAKKAMKDSQRAARSGW